MIIEFLVRSESDGYLKQAADLDAQPNENEEASTCIGKWKKSPVKEQDESQADNDAFFEALRVTGKPSSDGGLLHIEMRGRKIPQMAIFDLKTRARETTRPIDMDEVSQRLWVNQTPHFMFAEHFRGSFKTQDIQPMLISEGMLKWENDHEALLKHYQATMMDIIAVARSSATGKLQVIRKALGPLEEIQQRVPGDDTDVLPLDLLSKW